VPLAEIRDGAKIRRIEPHDAHEIHPLATGLGDPTRGVDAATIRVQQQSRHRGGIERRLAPLAAVGASDPGEVDIIPDQQPPSSFLMGFAAIPFAAIDASLALNPPCDCFSVDSTFLQLTRRQTAALCETVDHGGSEHSRGNVLERASAAPPELCAAAVGDNDDKQRHAAGKRELRSPLSLGNDRG